MVFFHVWESHGSRLLEARVFYKFGLKNVLFTNRPILHAQNDPRPCQPYLKPCPYNILAETGTKERTTMPYPCTAESR